MAIASSLFDDFTFHNKLVYLSANVFLENVQVFLGFVASLNGAVELMNQKEFFVSD
jgi:hypothetical protein